MPIELKGVTYTYMKDTPFERTALKDVSLTIADGSMTAIAGHTGSGKSTLVQHLNARRQPTAGEVLVDGENINANKISRRDIKRRVGLVFQYPEYQLFEETVEQDIAFGPRNMKLPDAEVKDRVREAARFTGVDETLFPRSPLELSGGQKRRIAIAGVIAMRPEVLILDEPTAGLDPAGSSQIMENIIRYREKTGSTVIIVSHSMDDAAKYGERLIVFNRGTICMDGTAEEVFSHAEELTAIGLSIPKATALASSLRSSGIPLNGSIYTHEQLVDALRNAGGVPVC